MNTKDFVVIPWGKPGSSVKLKYKRVQELQMEKIQLELENQKMEKKLREFQSTWNKGREEIMASGYHWKSGNVSKLRIPSGIASQSKENTTKLSAGKVKLKLLKEEIQAPAKQQVSYKMAHSTGSENPKTKRKVCGQCETKAALLVCLECGEDYCSGCFAKMHQKGALKFHRTTLLQPKSQILSNVLDAAHQFIKEVNPPNEGTNPAEASSKSHQKPKALLLQNSSEVETRATEGGEGENPRCKAMWEMPFDEEASAQSFQEALTEWRSGHQEENKEEEAHAKKPDSVEECEVQTNLKIWTEPINIEFTEDSLSYMEKLWLKKYRRTPQEQLRTMLPSTFTHPHEATAEAQSTHNENESDSDVEEITVKSPPLFMPAEKLNIERPPPSLTIVELDGTHGEEFEDPGNAVPYRVELADSESQLSSTFPDYQTCFPCDNDIHHHLIFNKEKADLLSFCLRTNTGYHKHDLKDFGNTVESCIYSDELKKIREITSFEKNETEKNIDPRNDKEPVVSCISLESKDSLPIVDISTSFIEGSSSQDTNTSLECSNPNEKPNLEDSKTAKPPLLRKVALRKKPVNERFQGPKKFFPANKNERLDALPSSSIKGSHSCSEITSTVSEDKMWIPVNSLSGYAGSDQQSDENPLPNMQQQKTGQKSQRPSTANIPVSNTDQRDTSCLFSSYTRSKSAAAQFPSRAASEISEIEYIDVTDKNELFGGNTADQQALDTLEKELNIMRSPADPSEEPHSLPSEELQAFNDNFLTLSQMSKDLLEMSCESDPYGAESSSSGRNTEMQSLLSLGDYSTDEEEEDFLDKQHVITLPWAKKV
ncbi:zinc finger B-box domain-containing protein 1 [Apodemus sylvaticus]|uniref:zinc finger B-box domain-containing protein 1 n=1 Tax=Apodemus sylvaticus TaxID=10129 RepID=UPI002243AC1E|nr:zinc finger B-box domain-containing protein 1 [Apodemus sylvaticus]